jgi:hypothetical protein
MIQHRQTQGHVVEWNGLVQFTRVWHRALQGLPRSKTPDHAPLNCLCFGVWPVGHDRHDDVLLATTFNDHTTFRVYTAIFNSKHLVRVIHLLTVASKMIFVLDLLLPLEDDSEDSRRH